VAGILIVEDNLLQAESLRSLLTSSGHAVCGMSGDGETAIALAKTEQPDLVVMDVKIGGKLDGIDTAELIQWICRCRLVFLTAHTSGAMDRRMRHLSPDAILNKSSSAEAIAATVERALR
jgi:DNA-binding NarL/FixJ family response regulator